MSYAANIQNDSEIVSQFVRVTCRLRVLHSAFSVHAGSVYVADFTHGPVHTFEFDGTAYTLGASASLSAGEFYYDRDQSKLYIRMADSGAPASTDFFVAFLYLFFTNTEVLWHESPDDSDSPMVTWQSILKKAPSFKITSSPMGVGFFPIEPTSLQLHNDHSLNYLIYHGSFNRTDCEVWSQLGDLEVGNVEKKLSGYLGHRITPINEGGISFDVLDKSIAFDTLITGAYFTANNVDPKFKDTAAMKIYGAPSENTSEKPIFEMVNIDYNSDAPTTSNNRKFALVYDPGAEYPEISVAGSQNNEALTTFFIATVEPEATKFRGNDSMWFDAGADAYPFCNSAGAGVVSYQTDLASTGVTAGNLRTAFIKNVWIVVGGESHRLQYGRDYTQTLHSGDFRGITLTSSCEANLSISTYDPNEASVWCSPVGKNVLPQYGGEDLTDFDGPSGEDYKGAFWQGINVLYAFLKTECGMSESEIDFTSFIAAREVSHWGVFCPIPIAQFKDYPPRREVLDMLLQSLLLKAYINPAGQFSVKAHQPIDAVDATIEKESIKSFSYEIDYSEMNWLKLLPAWEAQGQSRMVTSTTKSALFGAPPNVKIVEVDPQRKITADTVISSEGRYLHKAQGTQAFEHLAVDADDFEARVRDLFGERLGRATVQCKRDGLDRDPSDKLTVYRDSIPGFTDASGNSNDFEILEIEKSDDGVEMLLDDNKAASDKSGESYW